VKTIGQFQTFFEYRGQHVCADSETDLRLDCILTGDQKGLDPKMLLDPLEKQLDLPSLPIECAIISELSANDLSACTIDWLGVSPLKLCVASRI
jgi:hypothetical protein